MAKQEIKIERRDVESIVPYARNPRVNDPHVDRMAGLIREFGFRIPILITSDGTIIDGHLRIKAAQKLGMDKVPCMIADDMTPAQIKAFRLVVNKSVEWSEWDDDMLRLELEELKDMAFDLELTGFEMDEINNIAEKFTANEVDPPKLHDGDRAPFQQITFVVHDEQAEEIKNAIFKAKKEGGAESAVNENTNGNALAWICKRYNCG